MKIGSEKEKGKKGKKLQIYT